MLMTILSAAAPLLSGFMGYVMKFKAIEAQRRHEEQRMMIEGLAGRTSAADAASKRENTILGSYVRAFISLLLVLLLAAVTLAGAFGGFDINVPVEHPESSFLIFKRAAYTTYETLKGVVILPEFLISLTSAIFFWFGAGQARGSR